MYWLACTWYRQDAQVVYRPFSLKFKFIFQNGLILTADKILPKLRILDYIHIQMRNIYCIIHSLCLSHSLFLSYYPEAMQWPAAVMTEWTNLPPPWVSCHIRSDIMHACFILRRFCSSIYPICHIHSNWLCPYISDVPIFVSL